MSRPEPPPPEAIAEAVRRALAEDLGDTGDVTTSSTIPAVAHGRAALIAREPCIVAGLAAFEEAFRQVDAAVRAKREIEDGERAAPGDVVAHVEGPLRAILAAERTALNFVQRLSGIATLTRRYVDAAGGTAIKDTRKTTPGLRLLEKYAVRAGGGTNHRAGLYDAILIKDNHIAAAGGITLAVAAARSTGLWIEVEAETLEQVHEALEAGAHEILLDNMDPHTMREAVRVCAGKARTEASGGITLNKIRAVAATGVDSISVGALTHSAPAIDLSLEVE